MEFVHRVSTGDWSSECTHQCANNSETPLSSNAKQLFSNITFKHLEKQYFCSIFKSRFDSLVVQDVHERLLRFSDIKHAKALLINMAGINNYPPQIGYLQGICWGSA